MFVHLITVNGMDTSCVRYSLKATGSGELNIQHELYSPAPNIVAVRLAYRCCTSGRLKASNITKYEENSAVVKGSNRK